MPNGWKIESDLPTTYPRSATTIFRATSSFGGLTNGVLVKTELNNSGIGKQEITRLNGESIKFRIVTAVDGWGAWQTVATSTDLEQKADIAHMSMHLNSIGWKRFATSDLPNTHYGFAIFQLATFYNDNWPFTTTFVVNKSYNSVSIIPIGTTPAGFEPIIPKVRAAYLNGITYLELYYNTTGSNFTYIQMSNNLNFTLLDTFIDGSIPSGYNVKEVLLSNSVTTDKIDILSTDLLNGWTQTFAFLKTTVAKNGNEVKLTGELTVGNITTNTVIFNIPYHPGDLRIISVACSDGKNRQLTINTAGDISVDGTFIPWTTGLNVLLDSGFII